MKFICKVVSCDDQDHYFQDNGTLIVSVDALFGLCRKKSAGSSVHGPLSGTTVFENQDAVNSFVQSENSSRNTYSEVEHKL